MIRIENLVKRYGRRCALDHLNLEIGTGVIFGLLGPNGAGKTTLLSILNGLSTFQAGKIHIFGLPLQRETAEIRRRTAYIPQSPAFYENLSVLENLRFFGGIQKIRGAALRQAIVQALSVNRLEDCHQQKAGTLSGGQKQRLNIAIGLLNNPRVAVF